MCDYCGDGVGEEGEVGEWNGAGVDRVEDEDGIKRGYVVKEIDVSVREANGKEK